MFGFWKRSKNPETETVVWQLIKMIAVIYAPTLFFMFSPRFGIYYPWNLLGMLVMLFVMVMLVVADQYKAMIKITSGTPVRMILFPSLTTQRTIDTSIVARELLDQKTDKIIEVEIEGKKEKIPMGRFIYLVEFIEPISIEFGHKNIEAKRATLILPAPFEYVFMRFDEMELMLLRNMITAPAAWIAANVVDFEIDENIPILVVVDSGFHNMLRRMKMEFPEFTKKDILEGARKTYISEVIALKKELETQSALLEGLIKTSRKTQRSAEMLARRIYEAQYTEMAPKISIKSVNWKKAAPYIALAIIALLILLRFKPWPWW